MLRVASMCEELGKGIKLGNIATDGSGELRVRVGDLELHRLPLGFSIPPTRSDLRSNLDFSSSATTVSTHCICACLFAGGGGCVVVHRNVARGEIRAVGARRPRGLRRVMTNDGET